MKKLLLLFFILNISVGLATAADGKTYTFGTVKISQDNELPSGYFSKARNYLPGDNISITNPQNGAEVNVLNLGTLEEDDDVALLLAPEVAKKLGIDFSVQLRVKLSPRPDNYDEIASGTGVLSYGASVYADDDYTDIVADTIIEPIKKEEPVADLSALEKPFISESAPVADLSTLEKPFIEETSPVAVVTKEEPVVETPSALEQSELEENSDEDVLDIITESPVVEYKESIVEDKTDNEIVEDPLEEYEVIREEITDYFLTETEPEAPHADRDAVLEKIDSMPIAEIDEIPELESSKIEEAVIVEETPKLVSIEKITSEPIADLEPFDFSDSIETDAIKNEPEVVIIGQSDDSAEEYEEYEEEIYIPEIEEIVETTSVFSLTPTESVVPEYDPRYAIKQPEKTKPKTTQKEQKPKEKEVITIQPKPVIEAKPSDNKQEKKDVVVKDKNLRNGSYYIQIATATTKESGMNIVNKYSKYPIILVPFDTKEGYKVMVGPLTGDEYGAILAKFKAFGYKDAFVRKIK